MGAIGRRLVSTVVLATALGAAGTIQGQTVFLGSEAFPAGTRGFVAVFTNVGRADSSSIPSIDVGGQSRGRFFIDDRVAPGDFNFGEPVPEPASWFLLGGGLAIALVWRSRRRSVIA